MGTQIEIRVAGPCRHPKAARQPIQNGDGYVVADRCGSCHRIVQRKQCRGCGRRFRATEESLRHGRAYHSERCRRRAMRKRKKKFLESMEKKRQEEKKKL